jgi:hypothetical protein
VSVATFRFDNEKRRRPDHHARQAMLTPGYVLEAVRTHLGGIDLDPCTEPDNPTQAKRFYCLPDDGAALPWGRCREKVFCNPPYGEARNRWVERCIDESQINGLRIVLLIPSHTETKIFQRALKESASVLFIDARLRFGVLRENRRQEAASHGSALFGFGVDLTGIDIKGVVLTRSNRAALAAGGGGKDA